MFSLYDKQRYQTFEKFKTFYTTSEIVELFSRAYLEYIPALTQITCSQVHLLSGGPVGTRIFFWTSGALHTLIGRVGHNAMQATKPSSLHVHSLVHWSFVYCSPTFNKRPLGSGQPIKINNTASINILCSFVDFVHQDVYDFHIFSKYFGQFDFSMN